MRNLRSLEVLDWPELVARLAAEARSERGRAACQALLDPAALASDAAAARDALAEVDEAAALLAAGLNVPGLGFEDIEPRLGAALAGHLLGAEDCGPVAALCDVSAAVFRFFDEGGGPCPRLAARAAGLAPSQQLAAAIRATFDPAGNVRDQVSPELARLRREREAMSARVRTEIERLMEDEAYAPALQDRFWTIRDDRFVLPLRASAQSLGLGIVHDRSRTGETVFVEPTAVVEIGNRLKLCDLAIAEEIRRILEALSRDVATAAPALRTNMDVLAGLDVILAKARLGRAYEGSVPQLADETVVELRQARHPLLMLRAAREGFAVVSSDVSLGGAERVLVVSGPNAGGKTVFLKTLGLAALMARAGLLVPAAPGSRVGVFHTVLADIGDRQSVMGDLSTFSAHLASLVEITEVARTAAPGAPALVLLDELLAGTNPEQGAALARAALEALADLGPDVLVVATTHYDALKALPAEDARFANAGMEYDGERLRPTFRVQRGAPGRSYAFDIAARMGVPAAVLARARALAGGTTVALEEVIAALEAREVALGRETERIERARAQLESTAEDQRAARDALVRRERALAAGARASIDQAVHEARAAIREIVRQAAQAGSARAAEAARAALHQAAGVARRRVAPDPPPPGAGDPAERGEGAASAAEPRARAAVPTPAVGARVRLPGLGAEGVVVRAADERGKLKVKAGALTVEVAASEVEQHHAAAAAAATASKRPDLRRAAARAEALAGGTRPTATADDSAGASRDLAWMPPTADCTLDLRGHRADDVQDEVEAYLDRAALDGRSPIFIIHGHGTGALRNVVRRYLAASPYVRHFAPGSKNQGGDGVTVVVL